MEKQKTSEQSEPKKPQVRFSALALKAIAEAQKQNPKKSLDELTEEASQIYNDLKAQSKAVNGDAFTRASAVATILKEGKITKREDVVKAADELYTAKTGKTSNIRETTFVYSHAVHVLKVYGLIK